MKAASASEWTATGWRLNPIFKNLMQRYKLTSSSAQDKFFFKFGKLIRRKYRNVKTANVHSISKALNSLPLTLAAADCTRNNPEGWIRFDQFRALKDMQKIFGPADDNVTSQMTVSDVGFVRTLAEKGRDGMYKGGGQQTVWREEFLLAFNANCTSEREERKNATLREVDKQVFEARVAKATEVPAYRDEEDDDDDFEVADNTNGAANDSPTRNHGDLPVEEKVSEDEEDDNGDSDGDESEDDVPTPSRKRAKVNTNQTATSRLSLGRDTRK
jgi:hypothetical protein